MMTAVLAGTTLPMGVSLSSVLLCVDFTDICREACGKFHRLVTIVSGILHRRHGEGATSLKKRGEWVPFVKVTVFVCHGENKRVNPTVFMKC